MVVALGGLATTADLIRGGASARGLTAALQSGSTRQPRRGWHTTLPQNAPRVVAVAAGGRLTGAAALHHFHAWRWRKPSHLDVVLPHGASVPPGTERIRFTRRPAGWRAGGSKLRGATPGMVAVADALVHAIPRETFEEAVALLDWSLKTGRLDEFEMIELTLRLPVTCRAIVNWVDPRCDSFLESVVRTRLRLLGYRVSSQIPVEGFGGIDLVVENCVGIELDGREFHVKAFENDRRKDLAIVIDGRSSLRVSYDMVVNEWHIFEAAVERAVSSHRTSRWRRRGSSTAKLRAATSARPWSLPRQREPPGAPGGPKGMPPRDERLRSS